MHLQELLLLIARRTLHRAQKRQLQITTRTRSSTLVLLAATYSKISVRKAVRLRQRMASGGSMLPEADQRHEPYDGLNSVTAGTSYTERLSTQH